MFNLYQTFCKLSNACFFQTGKDDPQFASKHKNRPRTNVASGENAASTAGLRFPLNGDQTAASGETSSDLAASSGTANDGGKRVGNCFEASVLSSGDAGSVNPLSVETQFSESPAGPVSGGSTTDTASEVASLIHSPDESSSVSTIDSSFEGRMTKSIEDDAADDRGQLDDSKADLDNRLAAAAQVLASEDGRSTVLNTIDNDCPASVNTGDGNPLPDGNAADGEMSQKVNGQKCPPRFTTKVSADITLPFSFHFTQVKNNIKITDIRIIYGDIICCLRLVEFHCLVHFILYLR